MSIDILDGSRIHPESYKLTKQLALFVLECKDGTKDSTTAVEKIIESSDRLNDIDLEAFKSTKQQHTEKKFHTLRDIVAELQCPYKDKRVTFMTPNADELFNMLIRENEETFYNGKMVVAKVVGFARKKPNLEDLDMADPTQNDLTKLWQCPLCRKNGFPQLTDIWHHYDMNACPGPAFGVRIRLDNGLNGFIHAKNLSHTYVEYPDEHTYVGQAIECRVIKIDVERFSFEATCSPADMNGDQWKPQKDKYYDHDAEKFDLQMKQQIKKSNVKVSFIRRPISHPKFKNVSYAEATKLLSFMNQGECIIRPSSKGIGYLTLSWKVARNIYQHVDIKEQKDPKCSRLSLGTTLYINDEEFHDLNEILSRYMEPLTANTREILNHQYYKQLGDAAQKEVESLLRVEREKNPEKIHYMFSVDKVPVRFILSYLLKRSCKHEFVTVTSNGFQYRGQVFNNMKSMMKWFKLHYKDPIPESSNSHLNGPFNVVTL